MLNYTETASNDMMMIWHCLSLWVSFQGCGIGMCNTTKIDLSFILNFIWFDPTFHLSNSSSSLSASSTLNILQKASWKSEKQTHFDAFRINKIYLALSSPEFRFQLSF